LFSSKVYLLFTLFSAEHLFLHDYPFGSFVLNDDGWLKNSSGNLLLWVPPHCHKGLCHPSLCHIIGNFLTTKVELTHAIAHGPDWLK
jgi:hypothetical protein